MGSSRARTRIPVFRFPHGPSWDIVEKNVIVKWGRGGEEGTVNLGGLPGLATSYLSKEGREAGTSLGWQRGKGSLEN